MIVTQKLKRVAPNYPLGSSFLCPKNFFLLNVPGITVCDERRQRLFELLRLEDLAGVLATDKDSLKSNCNIVQVINKATFIEIFGDRVVKKFKNTVINILAETDQLEESPRYLGDSRLVFGYYELCNTIRVMVVIQN